MSRSICTCFVFFFNDTATTEIYTLSLHDALPISRAARRGDRQRARRPDAQPVHRPARRRRRVRDVARRARLGARGRQRRAARSEEHTSELQSRQYLVCRLLLEKKKKTSLLLHYYS